MDSDRELWLETRKKWLDKERQKTSMLKQKARVRWTLEGDENTRYFHSVIRNNYNKTNLRGININGVWNEIPSDIKSKAFRHFKALFEARDTPRLSLEDLDYPSITGSEAVSLEAPFTEEEILEAISECGSDKAPGPDGFNIRGCNSSFVTLIPKKSDPLVFGDFRPISLIGSYYKIVAKILANRLRKVIPSLVGIEQSAFLKGRYILDGVLIANETVEFLKAMCIKSFVFKVDFEKAFDSLNWDFLLEVMKCMGFESRWIKWINACINSTTVSVLINGSPTKEFNLERGIRQGDPLSPFLFILAAEGLNIMVKAAVAKGMYRGVEVGAEKSKNLALLGKWWWRFLTETDTLWVRVIRSLYGPDGGLFSQTDATNRGCTGVWRDIICAGHLIEGHNISFKSSFVKKVGNGSNTLFWEEGWCGPEKFSVLFPRLYRLEASKSTKVSERLVGDHVSWRWIREPTGRTTNELNALLEMISSISLDSNKVDSWRWGLSSDGIFTVKKMATLLDTQFMGSINNAKETMRNKLVPKKVELFIWRASKKKIPVRVELDKRVSTCIVCGALYVTMIWNRWTIHLSFASGSWIFGSECTIGVIGGTFLLRASKIFSA
ncbi:uncharacterized protein [Rutidosis leptorrhynchoides]|uniref:uncharacterized protein n=1 Tax=Rutidosis leptorrhynchoides TaxID=125765 RepID=UPI003A98F8D1